MIDLNHLRNTIYTDAQAHGLYEETDEKAIQDCTTPPYAGMMRGGYVPTLRYYYALRIAEEVQELIDAIGDEEHFNEE